MRDVFTWLTLGLVLSFGVAIFLLVLLIQAIF
jgi:hypothetical protein